MDNSRTDVTAMVQFVETNQGAIIYRIPLQLFPMLASNVYLALGEAGAHIEYSSQRELLGIDKLTDLEESPQPTVIRYKQPAEYKNVKLI